MESLPAWLIYADILGTVSVLGGFAVLFWTGRIVSKVTMDRFLAQSKEQMQMISNGFLAKIQEIAASNVTAITEQKESILQLLEAFDRQLKDNSESRIRMQQSVTELRVAIAEKLSTPAIVPVTGLVPTSRRFSRRRKEVEPEEAPSRRRTSSRRRNP